MTDASEWRGRVGEAWAEEWRRTDRSLAPVQAALLDTLVPRLCASAEVLDIGCGAGSTSLALAEARPDARVTGLDLSEALVAAARERAAGRAGDAAFSTEYRGAVESVVYPAVARYREFLVEEYAGRLSMTGVDASLLQTRSWMRLSDMSSARWNSSRWTISCCCWKRDKRK
mgnify:CR=1 FL=1